MAASLNREQLDAVKHEKGPLLIIAGAGTGKTTVITERIKYLLTEKGVKPDEILALTFTEKAAFEMEERVDKIMPYGYTELWISTFHAFCDTLLRLEAINFGINPAYHLLTESESVLFLKKNIFKLQLEYFRPLGNPNKFLENLLMHFSRLSDEDITPDEYLSFTNSLKKELELQTTTEERREEIKRLQELAYAFKTHEELKIKEGVMDFSNLISFTLALLRTRKNILKHYQEQFKYILVDEFQDTNYAQNELAILLAGDRKNITVVADDDQCLPGSTLISTPDGTKQIKDIKIGELVLAGVGKGAISTAKVAKVMKSKKNTTFITITTKSGKTITATHNHKMFCYVPKVVVHKEFYYIYLMYRKNLGWRMGITTDLAVRLKLERSADAIIGLRAFNTLSEALYNETVWSLQYQIPTVIFKERGGVIIQGEHVKKLYQVFDTNKNAQKFANDLGINLENFHYVLDAVTRGQSERIIINVYLCYRKYVAKRHNGRILKNPSILHSVDLQTQNKEIILKIKTHNISYVKIGKGIKVRYYSSNIEDIGSFAKKLADITGGFIETKSTIGTLNQVNMPAVVIPAGNMLEGLYVPVFKEGKIFYEQVTSVTRKEKKDTVYDLEIEKNHNFIANNIVVHNSIYRWRGAALSNVIQFKNNFPSAKIITLSKNYRSTQSILDHSYKVIQNNNPNRLEAIENINKKLTSERKVKGEKPIFLKTQRVDEEAEVIVQEIKKLLSKSTYTYKDIAILVRANNHSQPITKALQRAKIPYQFLGPGQLFLQEEVKDLIAYLRVLYNLGDSVSLFRVLNMDIFSFPARDINYLLNTSKKKNITLFETLEKVDETYLSNSAKEKVKTLTEMILRHLARVKKDTAGQILYYFISDTGLLNKFLEFKTAQEEQIALNISKFFDKVKTFEALNREANVYTVVEWIDLMMEMGDSPLTADLDAKDANAVNILTVHSSKGLEFPIVFIVNLVSDRFPTRERKEKIPIPANLIKEILPVGDYHIQEERRLFYVGMTRAKDLLYFTAALFYAEGKREKKISPFVYEALPDELIKQDQRLRQPTQLSLLDITKDYQKEPPKKDIAKQTKQLTLTSISYSQLQAFDICPLHYKARYLLNIPTPMTASLSFGISIHSTMKELYDILKNGQNVSESDMLSILRKNWISEGYQEKSHEQYSLKKGKQLVTNYYRKYYNPDNQPIATELPFSFHINNLRVTGKIDRIDKVAQNGIEIIDYKTGSVDQAYKGAYKFQLGIYALAATKIDNKLFKRKSEDITVSLYYLESDEKISQNLLQEDLLEIEKKIQEKVKLIEKSDFKCSRSIICANCEYKMLCNVI